MVGIKYMPFDLICKIGGIPLDLEIPPSISYLYNSILLASAFVPSNSYGWVVFETNSLYHSL